MIGCSVKKSIKVMERKKAFGAKMLDLKSKKLLARKTATRSVIEAKVNGIKANDCDIKCLDNVYGEGHNTWQYSEGDVGRECPASLYQLSYVDGEGWYWIRK